MYTVHNQHILARTSNKLEHQIKIASFLVKYMFFKAIMGFEFAALSYQNKVPKTTKTNVSHIFFHEKNSVT